MSSHSVVGQNVKFEQQQLNSNTNPIGINTLSPHSSPTLPNNFVWSNPEHHQYIMQQYQQQVNGWVGPTIPSPQQLQMKMGSPIATNTVNNSNNSNQQTVLQGQNIQAPPPQGFPIGYPYYFPPYQLMVNPNVYYPPPPQPGISSPNLQPRGPNTQIPVYSNYPNSLPMNTITPPQPQPNSNISPINNNSNKTTDFNNSNNEDTGTNSLKKLANQFYQTLFTNHPKTQVTNSKDQITNSNSSAVLYTPNIPVSYYNFQVSLPPPLMLPPQQPQHSPQQPKQTESTNSNSSEQTTPKPTAKGKVAKKEKSVKPEKEVPKTPKKSSKPNTNNNTSPTSTITSTNKKSHDVHIQLPYLVSQPNLELPEYSIRTQDLIDNSNNSNNSSSSNNNNSNNSNNSNSNSNNSNNSPTSIQSTPTGSNSSPLSTSATTPLASSSSSSETSTSSSTISPLSGISSIVNNNNNTSNNSNGHSSLSSSTTPYFLFESVAERQNPNQLINHLPYRKDSLGPFRKDSINSLFDIGGNRKDSINSLFEMGIRKDSISDFDYLSNSNNLSDHNPYGVSSILEKKLIDNNNNHNNIIPSFNSSFNNPNVQGLNPQQQNNNGQQVNGKRLSRDFLNTPNNDEGTLRKLLKAT